MNSAPRWLLVAWPLAVLFHLAGNSYYLYQWLAGEITITAVVQLGIVGSAIALLYRPRRLFVIGLGLAVLTATWLKMPVVGNHEIILALASLALVLGALFATARDEGGSAWLSATAPALRIVTLVAYGAIAFSKLNRDFFDPAVSCAVVLGDEVGQWLGLDVGQSPTLGVIAIAATAVIELSIPLLLLVGRWRLLGVTLAVGFHLVLALDPVGHVFDFSSTLFMLFLLFLPESVQTTMNRGIDRLRNPGTSRAVVVAAASAAVGHFAVAALGWPRWLVAYPLWLATCVVTVACVATALFWHRNSRPTDLLGVGRQRMQPMFLCVVGLTLLNAMSPYLELKTAASFNMYSNLHTAAGESNHFVVRSTVPLRSTEFYTIESTEAGDPLSYYLDLDLAVPVENLRYFMAQRTDERPGELAYVDVEPTMIRNIATSRGAASGVDVTSLSKLPASSQGRIGGYFAKKLGLRRSINVGGSKACLREWGPAY